MGGLDFGKDQLKVHRSSNGVLTVTGERRLEGNKWIRFRKEVNPPKDCKSNEIRARLSSGVLYLTIPKKVTTPVPQQDPPPVQDKGKVKQEMINGQSKQSEAGDVVNLPNENHEADQRPKSFVSRLKMERKTAIKVVAGVIVLGLMFTLLFYAYKFYAPMLCLVCRN